MEEEEEEDLSIGENKMSSFEEDSVISEAKFKKNVKQLNFEMKDENGDSDDEYCEYWQPKTKKSTKPSIYNGEGYSQPGLINNAIGYIKNGKLFLTPITDIYDMQHTLFDKVAAEAAQKKIDESKLVDEKPELPVAAPVRVKFGRAESEFRKKRREQSALHKQKLIDEDEWIALKVEKVDPGKFCMDPDAPPPQLLPPPAHRHQIKKEKE